MEQPPNPASAGNLAHPRGAATLTVPISNASLLDALRTAAEHSPTGIYAKDAQGRYVFANPAAARLLGREPEQVIGRTDEELLPADFAAALRTADQAALAQGRAVRRDDRLPDGTGAAIELLAVRVPVEGPLVCGVWTDPGELRRTQAQLRHALEQLEVQQRQNEERQRGFGITSGALPEQGDANGDGAVDASDLDFWSAQYGSEELSALHLPPSALNSIPEPSTGLLIPFVVLLTCCTRFKRRIVS